ncbi:hypothetical protein [Amycolatopsis suaedae]|uniref:PH domain-containing protein n=1 Tax=Amycolatopsis suaedae TaxID=2510978 RepID=A0A4Q7IX92_9PSEU|nr:hypothetical protein [Amycolatopsis suaedae]RZQ59561.1 hypothetical protein EWH70_33800 [Amycolatopsis suaedae]
MYEYAEYDSEPSPWTIVAMAQLLVIGVSLLAMVGGLVAVFAVDGPVGWIVIGGSLVIVLCTVWLVARLDVPGRMKAAPVPPARVSGLAEEHGLGEHVMTRKGQNPFAMFALVPFLLVAPLLLLVLMLWLLSLLGPALAGVTTKAAALIFLVGAVLVLAGPVLSLVALIVTPKKVVRTHLYHGGFVHWVNGRTQVVRWADVRSVSAVLGRSNLNPPELVAYRVTRASGRDIRIPGRREVIRDPFAYHLAAVARENGVSVDRAVDARWAGHPAPRRGAAEDAAPA